MTEENLNIHLVSITNMDEENLNSWRSSCANESLPAIRAQRVSEGETSFPDTVTYCTAVEREVMNDGLFDSWYNEHAEDNGFTTGDDFRDSILALSLQQLQNKIGSFGVVEYGIVDKVGCARGYQAGFSEMADHLLTGSALHETLQAYNVTPEDAQEITQTCFEPGNNWSPLAGALAGAHQAKTEAPTVPSSTSALPPAANRSSVNGRN